MCVNNILNIILTSVCPTVPLYLDTSMSSAWTEGDRGVQEEMWGRLFTIPFPVPAVKYAAADFVLNLHSTVLPSTTNPS